MPDITTDFANEGIRQADRIIDEIEKQMERFAFYRCKKSFALPYYDEDGHKYEDKKCYVWKGDIFRRTSANYLGCEVHLEQEPLGNWIEISKAQLAEYFSPKDGDGE